ncbi:HNH endonuclease [Paraburkholderia terrae]|uniref:HNH endonuclease n=1 Tax=Paraburkholderia terrae TaxID=311230 RepID=UPI00206A11B1|nr:HNH endonuclease [Paraburkholderia terrae]BDC37905.1 hypothetical protein PTKU15_12020 [Paraburkholderia terrae]
MYHIPLDQAAIEELRKACQYNHDIGALTRNGRSLTADHVRIQVGGKERVVKIGRVIYALVTGHDIPKGHIVSYRDGNDRNRAWKNLLLQRYIDLHQNESNAKRPLLPYLKLFQECFSYDPETGALTWRERPQHHFRNEKSWRAFNTRRAGKEVGTTNRKGNHTSKQLHMLSGKVEIHAYLPSIIWVLHFEQDPPAGYVIDHINRNGLDNRIANLRLATPGENSVNNSTKPGRSGYRGVVETENYFQAWIRINRKDKKHYESKCFHTLEQAIHWRRQREREHFGDFAVS